MPNRTMPLLLLLFVAAVFNGSACCGQALRVATYNLNWGNRQGDQLLDAIAASKADILCLQETTLQSARFLCARLSDSYPHFRASGHEGRYFAERFAFLSKQPLAELQYEPPTVGLFGFYSASISWHGTEARLVNVHLTPFVIPRDSGLLGVMNAILSTERKHALEIAAIAKTIDPSTPTIILGDFNSLSAFSARRHLAELGFVDSYGSIYEDAEEHPTWRWPTRPVPLSLRIDFIFHTGHFKTVESTIIQRAGSDHSLVVSVLKLLEQTRRAPARETRGRFRD